MNQHLHIITLGVKDLEASKKFYADTLGWKISNPQEGIAFFQAGGVVLALYPRESLAEDALVSPEGSGFSGITLAYNAHSEAEVDEIIGELKAKGVKIVKEPQKVFGAGTVLILPTRMITTGKWRITHSSHLMRMEI